MLPLQKVMTDEKKQYACIKPWLPDHKDARILDFGCGWGHQLLGLWCAGYTNIEGVELVEEQAAVAKNSSKGKVPIISMDGREYIADKENYYDLIILNDVFEHIPTSIAIDLLISLKRAIRPGGILVVRVPNMANICASYSRYLDITHVAGYTEYSMMQMFDQAGFEGHCIVPDSNGINLREWRPYRPLRGLGLRPFLNKLLHTFFYWIRGTNTWPTVFGYNLEIYSRKPQA